MRFDLIRYCLVKDSDGHTWLVPAMRREEFERYLLLCDGAMCWYPEPQYAIRVEGGLLTFTQPQLDGKDVG